MDPCGGRGHVAARYRRVVVKLSGEALAGEPGTAIDVGFLNFVSHELRDLQSCGVQVGVVVGGGNIWRGTMGAAMGIDRAAADYMGMLATIINGQALQEALERAGADTRMQTAIEMRQIAEPYIRRRAIRHLEKGRIVIFVAGTGHPFFSTDTAAALRAAEIEAEAVLMGKHGVDGVYDRDPNESADACRLDELTYMDMIRRGLKVMDATAASLCMENNIPVVVFDLATPGNMRAVAMGERVGTLVRGEP